MQSTFHDDLAKLSDKELKRLMKLIAAESARRNPETKTPGEMSDAELRDLVSKLKNSSKEKYR
jgi:hypothetical protein